MKDGQAVQTEGAGITETSWRGNLCMSVFGRESWLMLVWLDYNPDSSGFYSHGMFNKTTFLLSVTHTFFNLSCVQVHLVKSFSLKYTHC